MVRLNGDLNKRWARFSFALLVCMCLVGESWACVTNDDCGGPEQEGLCQSGVCQCGIGFSGDLVVDPIVCNSTCVPGPVPDAVAFLTEPVIGFSAVAGNLVLEVTLDAYAKQIPTTVAFNNPSDGTACSMMPTLLGTGVWSQETLDDAGQCDTKMTYRSGFAAEVAQACWETLASTTETGAQYEIAFNNYQTQVEVVQEGLAPFGQTAKRTIAARDDTTINRTFRRDYTISVATEFRPSSAPFQIVADGRIRYRLVGIEYDLLNNVIRVRVETETADTAKLANSTVNAVTSSGLSAITGGPIVGDCEASSPAGFCRQFHTIEFSDDPCAVASAEMVLDVEFQCADGSDPNTCGFQNLPALNIYSLDQLLLDYDACPRVIEYGIDAAASFLRLHEDVPRAVPLAVPAAQDQVLYGRCSIAPSADATFTSVTLSSLAVYRVDTPSNVNLGDQLSATFMTLVSPATSTSPTNPIWDFDLEIDPAFFDLTQTYYLEATLQLTFANTGPLTRSLQLPLRIPAQQARSLGRATVHNDLVMVSRVVRDGEQQSEDGVFSSTFRLTARAVEEMPTEPSVDDEEPPAAADNTGMIVGIAVGVACVAAAVAVIIVVVVVRKRRKQDDEGSHLPSYRDRSSSGGSLSESPRNLWRDAGFKNSVDIETPTTPVTSESSE